MSAARTVVLWCPDWPLVGVDPALFTAGAPVAVFVGEQVLACSAGARAEGVKRGLRRREAQRRCPELVVTGRDETAEIHAFEPVLTALADICPQLEVVRPGLCLFGAKGPGRYFGGDTALARATLAAVGPVVDPVSGARIGIADGPFAAGLAARHSPTADQPTIVGPGRTPAFLAPFPVSVLDRPELADLLVRLGLRTLGELAALPARQVVSRFGTEGALVHRLARGQDDPPLQPRAGSTEFDVHQLLDPPEEQIEPLAFVAKMLADRLAGELARRGLGCTRLLVEAESDHGETRSRLWRHEQTLTAAAVAQRVRWQLEGWLTGPADHRPSAGVTLLRLTPSGLHHEDGEQLRLFGGPTDADERAAAAITRLQGLLGFDAVHLPVPAGGRNPAEQIRLLPWGETAGPPVTGRRVAPAADLPWPGRLPAPYPSVLYPDALPAAVTGADGGLVTLDDRGVISAAPQTLSVRGGRPIAITDWAGPWHVDERWWDPAAHLRCARFQVTAADGSARLLALRDAHWWVEGAYE